MNERKQALTAVLRLVSDADTCLNHAIQEVKLRGLPGKDAWTFGAIGTARQAVRFARRMLELAIRDADGPKESAS